MGFVSNVVSAPAKAVASVAKSVAKPVTDVGKTAISSVGSVATTGLNAVGSVGSGIGQATLSPFVGASSALGSIAGNVGQGAGDLVSGVLGPGGSNAPALGAIGGALLGNPLALTGLGGAPSNAPTQQSPGYVVTGGSPSSMDQSSSGLGPILIFGGIAAVVLIAMKKRK